MENEEVTEVELDYTPRHWADILHDSITRWNIIILHRRAGKTTAVLNHLQKKATDLPNSQYAFIGPTYKQTKRIAWEMAKNIARPIPGVDFNESELIVKYPNGSKLFLAGSENVDSLRGIALWGGAQDEAAYQPTNLFSSVISKCLADHLGFWIWLGTPQGKNHFYRTYQSAQGDAEWTSVFRTIEDSLKYEEGETIDNLRQALQDDKRLVEKGEMTQEEFDQEWYCSFDATIKGAYYANQISEARKTGRIKTVPHDPSLMVHTVSDIGVGPAWSTGFYQRVAGELRMIDYWAGTEKEAMPDFVKMLQTKPYVYGKHFAPHDIRGTEISTGKTRIETAEKLGIKFEIIPSISVDDGINSGRLMFTHLWIDQKKCEEWIDTISQYRQAYNEKLKMFLKKPAHDWTSHGADVHRYASIVENEMTNEGDVVEYEQPAYEAPGISTPTVTPSNQNIKVRFGKVNRTHHESGYQSETPWQRPGLDE